MHVSSCNTQAYLVLLCFTGILKISKLKICGNPASSKSTGTIFPAAFVHFASVSHVGNSHNISNIFIMIILVTVICDQ